MLELAERPPRLDRFGDAHRLAIDDGFIQLEPRLAARRRRMSEDFERRSEHRAAAEITEDRKKHTSELQSLMRISYAVFCLKKKKNHNLTPTINTQSLNR